MFNYLDHEAGETNGKKNIFTSKQSTLGDNDNFRK